VAEQAPQPKAVLPGGPLDWQTNIGRTPDGQAVCRVRLEQGIVGLDFTMLADDLDRFAESLKAAARQARSGLIIAAPTIPNGQHLPKG